MSPERLCLVFLSLCIIGVTNGYKSSSLEGKCIYSYASCKRISKTASYVEMADKGSSWPKDGFCRTLIKKFVSGSSYSISASLYNVKGWKHNGGHLGILYNAKDINNFDFVYFRPHSASGCFQTGYVSNGAIKWDNGLSRSCPNGPPPNQKWFTVRVEVRGKSVRIFKDGQQAVKMTSHYPASGKGGVLLANGYKNTIRFKDYRIQKLPSYPHPFASCQSVIKTSSYVEMVERTGSSWPKDGFCRTLIKKFVPGSSYSISVSLYNVKGWTHNGGHLGILYNAKDMNNFDFVYFRPHSAGGCFQTGYALNGVIKWDGALSRSCPNGPPPNQKWFTVRVEVHGKFVIIFKDGQRAVVTTSHYPASGRGGVLLANGYKNTIRFKGYRIQRI